MKISGIHVKQAFNIKSDTWTSGICTYVIIFEENIWNFYLHYEVEYNLSYSIAS